MKIKNLANNLSFWSLIFSNGLVIFLAVKENWDFGTIMWIYWFQVLILILFGFPKILQSKNILIESGIKLENVSPKNQKIIQNSLGFFFLFLFFQFHMGYLSFLSGFGVQNKMFNAVEWNFVFFMTIIFFINHLFSFFYNRENDIQENNIKAILPNIFVRIVPIHLTLIAGLFLVSGRTSLLIFLILKTWIDIGLHLKEHKNSS